MERFLKSKLENGRFSGVSPGRSKIMAAIRGKSNKSTEVLLRMALVRTGIKGWILHPTITGKPDFFFPKERFALFVDGCFWHGCPRCGHTPLTRTPFWKSKIERNRTRDKRNVRLLKTNGVRSLRVWEHSLSKAGLISIIGKLQRLLSQDSRSVPNRLGRKALVETGRSSSKR
jgi:DNA mismatch endonuclease (patch repair protein)